MLLPILFFVCTILSVDARSLLRKRTADTLVSGYSRMVVLTNDISLGTNFTPPTTQQVLEQVLDPNHASMISSGLYTQAQVNAFVQASNAYMLARFGYNFSAGQVDPNTGITYYPTAAAPLVILFPYSAQNVVGVAFDTANLARGVTDSWVGSQFGIVIACTITQQFPGGDHAGETCAAGDILTYFHYNLLKTGVPSQVQNLPVFREILQCQSPWPSKNIINSQNVTDTLSKLEANDQNNKLGFFMENIVYQKDVTTGVWSTKTRVVITWA